MMSFPHHYMCTLEALRVEGDEVGRKGGREGKRKCEGDVGIEA